MTSKEKQMAGVKKTNEAMKKKKAEDVKRAINKLRKEGEFTLADLCREANVSRTYFTKHPDMRELADKYIIPTGYYRNRSKDSSDAYIQILKKENRDLKKAIEKIKKDIVTEDKYKEKYEKLLEENQKLKAQLEEAYNLNLPDHL